MLKSICRTEERSCIYDCNVNRNTWDYGKLCHISAKKRQNLLLWKLISDILWFFHYLFLGAYSGSAVALIGVFRELVFYKENQKGRKSLFYLLFFISIIVFSAIFTWKGVICIFPAIASIISIIGFWKANPELSQVLAFPVSGLMLT